MKSKKEISASFGDLPLFRVPRSTSKNPERGFCRPQVVISDAFLPRYFLFAGYRMGLTQNEPSQFDSKHRQRSGSAIVHKCMCRLLHNSRNQLEVPRSDIAASRRGRGAGLLPDMRTVMPPGADGIGFVSNDQTAAQSIGTGSHQIKTIEMSEAQPALSARERLRQHVNRNIQMQQELARQQAEKQGNFHGALLNLSRPVRLNQSNRATRPQYSCQALWTCGGIAESDTRLGKQDIHSNHANPVGNLNIHPKQLTHADVLSVPINMSVDMTGPLETHCEKLFLGVEGSHARRRFSSRLRSCKRPDGDCTIYSLTGAMAVSANHVQLMYPRRNGTIRT
eukprot:747935-Hanusia_phi.AAC.3